MSTSRFGQTVKANQQHLLEELVVKILGKNITVLQKRKTVAIYQHRLRFGSFPDTNPDDVQHHFQNVCEMLQIESREQEFRRLVALKEKLFSVQWESDVIDLQSSVLRFLLHLTGNLASSSIREPAVDMEIEQTPEVEEARGDEDMDLSGDETPLSEWSEDSEIETQAPLTETVDELPQVVEYDIPWAKLFLPEEKLDAPQKSPTPRDSQEYEGSLLNCWARVQLPDVSIAVCSLTMKSELQLVLDCLRVLQGESSTIFTWDAQNRCFLIDSQLQTLHFSAVSMRSALSWFGRIGCLIRDLMDWSCDLIDASGRQELAAVCGYRRHPPVPQNLCPTLSACAQAIHDQMITFLEPTLHLEEQLKSQNNDHDITLIWLKTKSETLAKKVELLHGLYRHLQILQKNVKKPQSILSCEILDVLFEICMEEFLKGVTSASGMHMIWIIFCESLKPFLAQITAWLYLGDISSISQDFLISTEILKNSENNNLWTDAFPIREKSCPQFMTSVLGQILDGGKALQMLRNQEYGNQIGDIEASENVKNGRIGDLIDEKWTKNLLYERFVSFILQQFIPLEMEVMSDQLCNSEISIFDQMAASAKIVPYLETEVEHPGFEIRGRQGNSDHKLSSEAVEEKHTSISEDATFPEVYVRMFTAMEALNKEIILSVDTSAIKDSALYRVLPDPTGRLPYSVLYDKIFCVSKLNKEITSSERLEGVMDCCSPPDVLIKEGLLDLIQQRSSEIMKSFISCLLTELGLLDEICVLKNVFLMGSPAVAEWVRRFSETLNSGLYISDLSEYQVIMDMQDCFLNCGVGEKLPVCGDNEFEDLFLDMRSTDWDQRFPEQSLWNERSPQELEDCSLLYPLDWPLSLLVNDPKLAKYNSIFLFLMKLQWANYAIKDAKMLANKLWGCIDNTVIQDFKILQNWRNIYRMIHEMNHFLKSLQQYVFENVHHSFESFQKRILNVGSVSEMIKEHDEMLESLQRFSFQSRKKQWKTVHNRISTIFHRALNFSSLWQQFKVAASGRDKGKQREIFSWMETVLEEYNDAKSSAMMILHIYSHSLGGNRELTDLINVLNFNQTYVHIDPV